MQLHTGRVVVLYGRSDAREVIFVPGSIVMQEVLAATATGGAAAGISAESISPLVASCSQAWQNEGARTNAAEQPFIFALVVLAAVLAWVAAVRHCVHGCCTHWVLLCRQERGGGGVSTTLPHTLLCDHFEIREGAGHCYLILHHPDTTVLEGNPRPCCLRCGDSGVYGCIGAFRD